jgi:hypothetical protein
MNAARLVLYRKTNRAAFPNQGLAGAKCPCKPALAPLPVGIKSAPLHSIIRKRHLKFYEKEEIVKTENSGICLPPPYPGKKDGYPGKFHERSPQASQRPKISKKNTVPEIKVIENSAFICASRGSNPGHPD